MTGANLTRKMLAIRPYLPVLIYTGYGHDFSAQTAQEIGAAVIFPSL